MLGTVMLAGELAIGTLSIWFPHETQMYKDFYILHRRACWLPADAEAAISKALAGSEIDFRMLNPKAACFVLAQGWSVDPVIGTITNTKTAWLALPPPGSAKMLDITLANASPHTTELVVIRLNRQPLRQFAVPPGGTPVDLRLTILPQTQDYTQIEFDRPNADGKGELMLLHVKWID